MSCSITRSTVHTYMGYKTCFISTWQHEKQLYSNVQAMVAVWSDNGLVPSGDKPLPEPMLTQIFVVIWLVGPNELIHGDMQYNDMRYSHIITAW